MAKLSVNVNKICTLRNTRPNLNIPDLLHLSRICLRAGCDGLTVHPRPDQRHVRPGDVYALAELLRGNPGVEFNIEGNPFHEYMRYAREIRPTQCTLVPDDVGQSTSDHGWDLRRDAGRLGPVVEELKGLGVRVSLFMDAVPGQMKLAASWGWIAWSYIRSLMRRRFREVMRGRRGCMRRRREAAELGLGINAGHDLNLENLGPFLREVPGVLEVSIGHALIGDAIEFGLEETVRRYLAAARNISSSGGFEVGEEIAPHAGRLNSG